MTLHHPVSIGARVREYGNAANTQIWTVVDKSGAYYKLAAVDDPLLKYSTTLARDGWTVVDEPTATRITFEPADRGSGVLHLYSAVDYRAVPVHRVAVLDLVRELHDYLAGLAVERMESGE